MRRLCVEPGTPPLTWGEFVSTAPPFSIALDGYVGEGPRYDDAGPHRNFNHHEGVDRLATRATCAQVLMDIRQGLFDRFRDEGEPTANVYVNDCDEDVCTSWFLLSESHLVEPTMNPLINRLVAMEDALDACAGAYPFPKDLPVLRELAWVYEPYRRFRASGGLASRNAASFEGVITDVVQRIKAHVTGHGGNVPLDTRYERIGGGEGWAMVREIGPQARTAMFGDGIRAFISVAERPDGRWAYTVGRMSEYVRFPVPTILTTLNGAEADGAPGDRWGGGSTIGGSPRIGGSQLTPDEVAHLVGEALP